MDITGLFQLYVVWILVVDIVFIENGWPKWRLWWQNSENRGWELVGWHDWIGVVWDVFLEATTKEAIGSKSVIIWFNTTYIIIEVGAVL